MFDEPSQSTAGAASEKRSLGNEVDGYPTNMHQVDSDSEWDEAIASFADTEVEAGYEHACQTLHRFLTKLDLTPEERKGLDPSLDQLNAMLKRLEETTVQIAVFGMVGRGKSSILNALLGQSIFETGPLHGVTQSIERADWSVRKESIAGTSQDAIYLSLKGTGQSSVELIDTPGLDEVNGEERERLARQVARQADLILFIISGDITKLEYQALAELRQLSKPILLVFNKVDQYPETDRAAIYSAIRHHRVQELLSPDEIVMAAASPVIKEAIRQPDGSVTLHHRRGRSDVEALKLKILNVLHHEGKAMTALNTMLFADDVNEAIVHRKLTIRDEAANQVIWNSVVTKAMAIALNPVTAIDVLSGAVIDGVMVMTLSRLYGIAMTQQGAFQLLQRMALSLGGITVSELAATLGLSSLKGLLGLSIPATGGFAIAPYISVAITQASVAGVSTYGVGQVAKTYLANGASWGNDSPKIVIQEILSSLDETYILNRVKQELQEKLKHPHFPSPLR